MTASGTWLLLHGTPLTPAVWDDLATPLGEVLPVRAPQLGTPSGPDHAQAELAGAVLEDLPRTADPLHVVGHSFGGQVALEVALRAPDRVASLFVLCSRASPFPAFAATATSLRQGVVPDVEASLGRWFLPEEVAAGGPVVDRVRVALAAADHAVWADELDAIAAYDRRTDLGRLGVPTTFLAADDDHVGTPAEMSSMAGAVPGATFDVLPRASHMSPFLRPRALAGRILAALP